MYESTHVQSPIVISNAKKGIECEPGAPIELSHSVCNDMSMRMHCWYYSVDYQMMLL